jgi:hypothetical protein
MAYQGYLRWAARQVAGRRPDLFSIYRSQIIVTDRQHALRLIFTTPLRRQSGPGSTTKNKVSARQDCNGQRLFFVISGNL